MKLRRSPTLELAASIDRLRAEGQCAWSLSTPAFSSTLQSLMLRPEWSLLTPAAGLASLRDVTRDRLFAKWDAPEHDVLIVAGAKAGIFSALRALVPMGSAVLVIAPYWPSYADLAAAAGLNFRTVDTALASDFDLNTAEIDELVAASGARAIIMANPNNPTGKVYSGRTLERMSAIAQKHGLILIIDESFSGIIFESSVWAESRCKLQKHIVIMNSFSKNMHLQGLRVGACLAHGSISELILTVHQTVMSGAPSLSQHVIGALMQSGAEHRPDYGEQRSLALRFVRQRGWRAFEPQGTFYVFPEIPDLGAFRETAARRNIFILSGDTFGMPYGRHFRLCFGRPVEDLLEIFAKLDDREVDD